MGARYTVFGKPAMRMVGATPLTKVGDVEMNPSPITQTNKSMFAISAINKYMLGSRYP